MVSMNGQPLRGREEPPVQGEKDPNSTGIVNGKLFSTSSEDFRGSAQSALGPPAKVGTGRGGPSEQHRRDPPLSPPLNFKYDRLGRETHSPERGSETIESSDAERVPHSRDAVADLAREMVLETLTEPEREAYVREQELLAAWRSLRAADEQGLESELGDRSVTRKVLNQTNALIREAQEKALSGMSETELKLLILESFDPNMHEIENRFREDTLRYLIEGRQTPGVATSAGLDISPAGELGDRWLPEHPRTN